MNIKKMFPQPVPRMKPGTELVITSETNRPLVKLVDYVSDDILCVEAKDGKQFQVYKKNVVLRFQSARIF